MSHGKSNPTKRHRSRTTGSNGFSPCSPAVGSESECVIDVFVAVTVLCAFKCSAPQQRARQRTLGSHPESLHESSLIANKRPYLQSIAQHCTACLAPSWLRMLRSIRMIDGPCAPKMTSELNPWFSARSLEWQRKGRQVFSSARKCGLKPHFESIRLIISVGRQALFRGFLLQGCRDLNPLLFISRERS
jgi:hypothetical protein